MICLPVTGCSVSDDGNVQKFLEIKNVALRALKDCLGVKRGEKVLVITDTIRKDIAIPFYMAAQEMSAKVSYAEIVPRSINGQEPPDYVAAAMLNSDVILMITKASLTHTRAKKAAGENGARGVSIPLGFGDNDHIRKMLTTGGMTMDYKKMSEGIERMISYLNRTGRAHVKTAQGTDLVIEYGGREFYRDSGIAMEPGVFTNLPAGEAYVAPVNVNGRAVIDVAFGRIGTLASPLDIMISEGRIVSISGYGSDILENVFSTYGDQARIIAEFGFGTNPKAHFCGVTIEDEKVFGTVHIAIGSNMDFGDDIDAGVHLDGIISSPEVYVDGKRFDINSFF